MKLKDLVSKVAKLEGKKHQASIGDVREIIGIISDLVWSNPQDVVVLLAKNGSNRAKKKKK